MSTLPASSHTCRHPYPPDLFPRDVKTVQQSLFCEIVKLVQNAIITTSVLVNSRFFHRLLYTMHKNRRWKLTLPLLLGLSHSHSLVVVFYIHTDSLWNRNTLRAVGAETTTDTIGSPKRHTDLLSRRFIRNLKPPFMIRVSLQKTASFLLDTQHNLQRNSPLFWFCCRSVLLSLTFLLS